MWGVACQVLIIRTATLRPVDGCSSERCLLTITATLHVLISSLTQMLPLTFQCNRPPCNSAPR